MISDHEGSRRGDKPKRQRADSKAKVREEKSHESLNSQADRGSQVDHVTVDETLKQETRTVPQSKEKELRSGSKQPTTPIP